jgi:hypothetical protein
MYIYHKKENRECIGKIETKQEEGAVHIDNHIGGIGIRERERQQLIQGKEPVGLIGILINNEYKTF